VLIFTQMSRMLDVLEIFLNLHGHSYLRLDGATGVDKRQKLMDRFNNDTKVFCFILSTRSGGLGINLTGADTVVFYDSDWNPAMDAQAQDRAHRIGQTREVHIYRLISERTIEENILRKARQRRHLDFLAITAGQFTPEQMYNQDSLREMLTTGVAASVVGGGGAAAEKPAPAVSAKDVEAAFIAMEDDDDVEAMKGAQKENVEEMQEFDDAGGPAAAAEEDEASRSAKGEEGEESGTLGEDELAAYESQLGPDVSTIEAHLRPVERYAFRFRTVQDPFCSLYYISDEQRRREVEADQGEWDVEALEREAAEEEARCLTDGELLATSIDMSPDNIRRLGEVYFKERSRVQAERRRRQMLGTNWERRKDAIGGYPFFYNTDTGEAQWEKPPVLVNRDAVQRAKEEGFGGLPPPVLFKIFSFLRPTPERLGVAMVCRKWCKTARSHDFHKRVIPSGQAVGKGQVGKGVFASLADALAAAGDGETLILDSGNHWVNGDLIMERRVRIMSEGYDPSRTVIELDGSIIWRAWGGLISNVTVRRPRECPDAVGCVRVVGGRLDLSWCHLKNNFGKGASVTVTQGGRLGLFGCQITGSPSSGVLAVRSHLAVCGCELTKNHRAGITLSLATAHILDNRITGTVEGPGLNLLLRARVILQHNDLTGNAKGSIAKVRSKATSAQPNQHDGIIVHPGWKNLVDQAEEDLDSGLIGAASYKLHTATYDKMVEGRGFHAPRVARASLNPRFSSDALDEEGGGEVEDGEIAEEEDGVEAMDEDYVDDEDEEYRPRKKGMATSGEGVTPCKAPSMRIQSREKRKAGSELTPSRPVKVPTPSRPPPPEAFPLPVPDAFPTLEPDPMGKGVVIPRRSGESFPLPLKSEPPGRAEGGGQVLMGDKGLSLLQPPARAPTPTKPPAPGPPASGIAATGVKAPRAMAPFPSPQAAPSPPQPGGVGQQGHDPGRERIAMFDPDSRKKVSGPMRRNLESYLRKNPRLQIYDPARHAHLLAPSPGPDQALGGQHQYPQQGYAQAYDYAQRHPQPPQASRPYPQQRAEVRLRCSVGESAVRSHSPISG
jgi:hypothetical protein